MDRANLQKSAFLLGCVVEEMTRQKREKKKKERHFSEHFSPAIFSILVGLKAIYLMCRVEEP